MDIMIKKAVWKTDKQCQFFFHKNDDYVNFPEMEKNSA